MTERETAFLVKLFSDLEQFFSQAHIIFILEQARTGELAEHLQKIPDQDREDLEAVLLQVMRSLETMTELLQPVTSELPPGGAIALPGLYEQLNELSRQPDHHPFPSQITYSLARCLSDTQYLFRAGKAQTGYLTAEFVAMVIESDSVNELKKKLEPIKIFSLSVKRFRTLKEALVKLTSND